METTELIWTDAKPPSVKDTLDVSNPETVLAEIRRLEDSTRRNTLRSGGLLSIIWHGKWFASADYPDRNLTNMTRWLLKDHSIDLSPQDLRVRIAPFDTFAKFGDIVMDWLEPFAPSTAYELARAARLMLAKDPLMMDDAEIEDSLHSVIEPITDACPYGTGAREVFPKLQAAGLLTGKGGGGGKRPRVGDLELLDIINLSEDGMIDGLFIPRRLRRRDPQVEKRWAKWFNDYCEVHDIERDEAFRRIMDVAMQRLSVNKSEAA